MIIKTERIFDLNNVNLKFAATKYNFDTCYKSCMRADSANIVSKDSLSFSLYYVNCSLILNDFGVLR